MAIKEVDPDDPVSLEEWAELTCRGWTVSRMAGFLNVEPTMEAVVERVTRGIPDDSRGVAAKICERELKRSERRSGGGG